VPEVPMGGNHEEIRRWRRKKALEKTLRNRPELLVGVALGDEDRSLLDELQQSARKATS
jgi:tRNA (guanine37-N1)-methyltransferase